MLGEEILKGMLNSDVGQSIESLGLGEDLGTNIQY